MAELQLKVEWKFEEYLYEHLFNLNQPNLAVINIYKDNIKLDFPNSIFKYYSDSDWHLNALEEGYFYFTHPEKLNDPFELLQNRHEIIVNNPHVKNRESLEKHRANLGICCFSLNNDNPVLWGNYTNNYRGFCVEYDLKLIPFNKNISWKAHVSYLKDYSAGNENLDKVINAVRENSFLNEEQKRAFVFKLKMIFEYTWKQDIWNYENEFRFVSIVSESFDRKVFFDQKVIKAIYVDHKLSMKNPELFLKLKSLKKEIYKNAKFYEMKPNPIGCKMHFNEIKE
ncbi:DUF2971 domain-containing protein [Flavobacterium pectinovorum]|uniref:DUF2971 domain-containing protein n=1 Tax=Flavobacterium pectinovorum TaxID=29533 RepID=UPI001FAD64C5|nr:DUF2971 domain-containing protein [Flavobacterium pectinovorum]MCI9845391.1 DUF2971 domain-containing protein [Flavobacterium pectinovorum]